MLILTIEQILQDKLELGKYTWRYDYTAEYLTHPQVSTNAPINCMPHYPPPGVIGDI